jgi:hypothetical protein
MSGVWRARSLTVLIILFLSSCATTSTTSTASNEQASRISPELAAEELARMSLSNGMYEVYMKQTAEAGLTLLLPALEKEMGRELTRSESEALDEILREIIIDVYPEEMWVRALGMVNRKVYTPAEVEALVRFYQTETGQRVLQRQSFYMSELESAVEKLILSKEEEFVENLVEKMSERFQAASTGGTDKEGGFQPLTVAETVAACNRLQESDEFPIGCAFEYFDGKPTLMITFANQESGRPYADVLDDKLIGPFCQAANSANRQAAVIMVLVEENLGSLYSCESDEWSEWTTFQE